MSTNKMIWITNLLLIEAEISKQIGYLHKINYQSDLGPVPKFRLAKIISNSSIGLKKN